MILQARNWNPGILHLCPSNKGKSPRAVKIELALVNLNDKEKPYKFMTKVFLPVKK